MNALSQVPYLAELPAHKQLVKNLTYAGVFSLEWDGACKPFTTRTDMPTVRAKAATSCSGTDRQARHPHGSCAKCPTTCVQRLTEQRNLDLLKNYLDMNPDLLDNYSVGAR